MDGDHSLSAPVFELREAYGQSALKRRCTSRRKSGWCRGDCRGYLTLGDAANLEVSSAAKLHSSAKIAD